MRRLAFGLFVIAGVGAGVSSDEILTRVAEGSAGRQQSLGYSSLRQYHLRNIRIAKEAKVRARVNYNSADGFQYSILDRSGSTMLAGIIEKLLAYEADESRPGNHRGHEIAPSNYCSRYRGLETEGGRPCYVLDVTPIHNDKHLIKGTLWIDAENYAVVKLEGRTSTSVSIWIGTPRITEEFTEIGGLWLPSHMRATSSGFLLGTSELEIQYSDYRIEDRERALPVADRQ